MVSLLNVSIANGALTCNITFGSFVNVLLIVYFIPLALSNVHFSYMGSEKIVFPSGGLMIENSIDVFIVAVNNRSDNAGMGPVVTMHMVGHIVLFITDLRLVVRLVMTTSEFSDLAGIRATHVNASIGDGIDALGLLSLKYPTNGL